MISNLASFACVNAILIFTVGLFTEFNNPKNKAIFGIIMALSLILYLLTISIVIIKNLFDLNLFKTLILSLCLISPFIIGKLAEYNTLKKYTFIQILFFILSLGSI